MSDMYLSRAQCVNSMKYSFRAAAYQRWAAGQHVSLPTALKTIGDDHLRTEGFEPLTDTEFLDLLRWVEQEVNGFTL